MNQESFADQLSRLHQMATDDGEGEVWDLSNNDQLAIGAVLRSHDALLAALKKAVETIKVWHSIHDADDEAWDIYRQHAPEMKVINAAIQQADGAQEPTK